MIGPDRSNAAAPAELLATAETCTPVLSWCSSAQAVGPPRLLWRVTQARLALNGRKLLNSNGLCPMSYGLNRVCRFPNVAI